MRTLHQMRMSKWVKGYKAWSLKLQRLQASNILDNFYAKYVILQGELSSAEIQAAVGKNYGKLQFPFNNFRNNFKKTYQQQKVSAKPKRQATLNDVFSKASSSN